MAFLDLHIPFIKPQGIHMFQFPAEFSPQENWVHRYISWPRKYAEWIQLIEGFRKPLFPNTASASGQFEVKLPPAPLYIPNTVPDCWFHRHIAADQLEEAFERNQWIRWQMRRVAMELRRRVMDKRIIGETDVGTLEPIPPTRLVSVYDWNSRAKYQFHVNTIHQQIVGALRYQTMAISRPQNPKNPYTNMVWTTGQLSVLLDQIHRLLWKGGRKFMDPAAQAFHHSQLCMSQFIAAYGTILDVECAYRFFHDTTSEYWELLYTEGLLDMFTFLHPSNKLQLRTLLVDRSFPTHLLGQWDELVYGFWCYDNLNRIVLRNMCSVYEMIEEARAVLGRTEAFLKVQRERKVELKRKNTNRRPS